MTVTPTETTPHHIKVGPIPNEERGMNDLSGLGPRTTCNVHVVHLRENIQRRTYTDSTRNGVVLCVLIHSMNSIGTIYVVNVLLKKYLISRSEDRPSSVDESRSNMVSRYLFSFVVDSGQDFHQPRQ